MKKIVYTTGILYYENFQYIYKKNYVSHISHIFFSLCPNCQIRDERITYMACIIWISIIKYVTTSDNKGYFFQSQVEESHSTRNPTSCLLAADNYSLINKYHHTSCLSATLSTLLECVCRVQIVLSHRPWFLRESLLTLTVIIFALYHTNSSLWCN